MTGKAEPVAVIPIAALPESQNVADIELDDLNDVGPATPGTLTAAGEALAAALAPSATAGGVAFQQAIPESRMWGVVP